MKTVKNGYSKIPDVFDLKWRRDTAGYVLKKTPTRRGASTRTSDLLLSDPGGLYLVRGKGELELYSLKNEDDLHRRFAMLSDDPEALIAFVSEYGFLGLHSSVPERIERESVTEILAERDKFREVLATLDGCIQLEQSAKRVVLEMRDEGFEVNGSPGDFRTLAGGLFNRWVQPLFAINLNPGTTSRGDRTLSLSLVPRTLLSCMWFLLAKELSGSLDFGYCANEKCRAIIRKSRPDIKTCSTKCRKALSDVRKAQVQSKPAREKKS